jgi:hypothetical protein
MGCNCKATKKIAYINQRYGTNPPQKQSNIVGRMKDIAAFVVMILCLPFIFIHVLYINFFTKDKKITFSEMFGKKKKRNVRKQ